MAAAALAAEPTSSPANPPEKASAQEAVRLQPHEAGDAEADGADGADGADDMDDAPAAPDDSLPPAGATGQPAEPEPEPGGDCGSDKNGETVPCGSDVPSAPPAGVGAEAFDLAGLLDISTTPDFFGAPVVPGASRVSIGAFADAGVTLQEPIESVALSVGQIVIHSRAQLGGGFSVFAEVSLNNVPVWQTRVERLLFDWEASDHLKVSVGRLHSPVTWWNSTFHHGLWLQTTASRPRMVGFDDAFIPNHYKGLQLSGLAPFMQKAGLRYRFGVSNSSDDDAPADGVTTPYSGSVFATLAFEPVGSPFLRVGVSGNHDIEQALGLETRGARRTQAGAHFAYTKERPEVIAEAVFVQHTNEEFSTSATTGSGGAAKHAESTHHAQDAAVDPHAGHDMGASGDKHRSGASYLQVAWRLRGADERFKPYLRYELIQLHSDDISLVGLSSEEALLGGVRIDLTHQVALKTEGIWDLQRPDGWSAQVQLSAAW